jgi:hypothetical protein
MDGKKVPVWFAPDESRPLLAFAGLLTRWTSVRKAKASSLPSEHPELLAGHVTRQQQDTERDDKRGSADLDRAH